MRHWRSDDCLREVVRGIRAGIERTDFDNLPPLPELAQLLKQATTEPPDLVRRAGPEDPRETEEREALADLIERWSKSDIPEQSPLPYRRVLTDDEIAELRQKLKRVWGIGKGYWYPMTEEVHPATAGFPLVAVAENVHGRMPLDVKTYSGNLDRDIRRFLREQSIERVFELRTEYGHSYRLDTRLADMRYTGSEGFWFSDRDDWIVYCSHEGAVTLGGAIAVALGTERA
jgi:hypothetical protein